MSGKEVGGMAGTGIYTPEQREARDKSVWTKVQGVLAPLQFLAFAISVACVINYLHNDTGYGVATASILVKTAFLYAIMVTGAIWEKAVFGRYLFAEAFFWEDVVSMAVIFLHTVYIVVLLNGLATPREQMWLALAAYSAYVINALQFLIKFGMVRASANEADQGDSAVSHLGMEAQS